MYDSIGLNLNRPDETPFEVLENLLDCPKGGYLLHVGGTNGRLVFYLARRAYRVTGLDRSPARVEAARSAAAILNFGPEQIKFEVADLENFVFPANTFDAIVCMNTLELIKFPGKTLIEFWRLLKPGRRLIIKIPGAYSPAKNERWKRFLPGREVIKATANDCLPWEMENLLKELGWRILDQFADFDPAFSNLAEEPAFSQPGPGTKIISQTLANYWFFVVESAKDCR